MISLPQPTNGGRFLREQIALFGRSRGVIEVQAEGESSFVLGSARQDFNAVIQTAVADRFDESLG